MSRENDIRQQIEAAAHEYGFERVGSNGVSELFRQVKTGQEVSIMPADHLNQKTAAMYIQKFRKVSAARSDANPDQEDGKYITHTDMTGWPIDCG